MVMKKFLNDPDNVVAELLEGYALAFPQTIRLDQDGLIVRAKPKDAGKVAVVTLGGSGHEPALSGFVGQGLLDISVPGNVFAAPGPPKCLAALKKADLGAGILLVVLNHAGDMLTAGVTMEMAEELGLNVSRVTTQEDIAGEPGDRRGLAGCLFVYKIAGAAAERGDSLAEVTRLAEKINADMRTLAVAVRPATHPNTGQAIFELPDDEMEVGMGQHGEGGTGRMKLKSADETAELMINALLADLGAKSGDRLLLMLNGVGATTLMELFVIFRKVHQVCAAKGIAIVGSAIDEFLTVQEMAGFQMCAARVDDELLALWQAPCDAPYFKVR
jgi:dihydroxyacetone kinase-like protein